MAKRNLLGSILKTNTKVKIPKSKKSILTDDGFSGMYTQTLVFDSGRPTWSNRNYSKFSEEAYIKNVIANRAISLIASSIASIKLSMHRADGISNINIGNHPALGLLSKPAPNFSGSLFFESMASYKLISGNCFILAVCNNINEPRELYTLRPDRVNIVTDDKGFITAYQYKVGTHVINYPVDKLTGHSRILHLKNFHPLNDHYGLSPVEAAAFSIDQHNNSSMWNQSLLQNGAKPSGALVLKSDKTGGGYLTDEQFLRLKKQMEEQFAGAANAGRPLLLEGGLEWKEMSMSPKDMDFIEAKHSAARDIALAFGVPPQMLGIPGDNTYSNLAEARLSLWEQTIIPIAENIINGLNNWLLPMYKNSADLKISLDMDKISALTIKREKLWASLQNADFLTVDEKRKMVGFGPLEANYNL